MNWIRRMLGQLVIGTAAMSYFSGCLMILFGLIEHQIGPGIVGFLMFCGIGWALLKVGRRMVAGDAAVPSKPPQKQEGESRRPSATHRAIDELAEHYLTDTSKFIASAVTVNNLQTSLKKVDRVIQNCQDSGARLTKTLMNSCRKLIEDEYRGEVAKQLAREEQQRIKEKIRDEQRAERERDAELKRIDRERESIQKALDTALQQARDEHSAEVEQLRAQLAEATAKNERAKSMAQMTKSGFVYVISNVGSFGENIFKVGMTRRLEPYDRVKELGDASVPFPFDVHAMISSEDAPNLEVKLHQELNHHRVNKANVRKEFFRLTIDEIVKAVERLHGKVEYRATADAFEYNETKAMEESGVDPSYFPEFEEDDDSRAA